MKKNGADKYDFLREPWSWGSKNFVKPLFHKIFAQKPSGMPGEQEHHISSVPFFFFITYKIMTCERTLIAALQILRKHHKICDTTLMKRWILILYLSN